MCINKLEKQKQRTNRHTDREQTDRQTENSKPEATLIPVDRQGERANNYILFKYLAEYNSEYLLDL